jgi:hypothetical protein
LPNQGQFSRRQKTARLIGDVGGNNKWEMIMFIDTDETRKLRQKYNLQMQKSGIKTFQDMDRIEMDALESGDLSQKYKELIALGISISKACYG